MGCFIAFDGNTRLGLTTTTVYGKQLAWIGNVIVDKSHRGERIGQSLVRRALSFLQRANIKRIALYCFKEHESFYEGLGFVKDKPFLRLKRTARAKHLRSHVEFEHTLSLSRLIAADRKAFGADRSRLIRAVLSEKFAWYLGSSDKSYRTSYIMAKDYDNYYELGPWVCIGQLRDFPSQMIARALTMTGRVPVEVSCLQENRTACETLRANGFRKVREGYRMSFGKRVRIGDDRLQFALGFLDKG
jgi:predicted GNAT family acetyltransferase